MKITVENTGTVVQLNGVPARLWVGRTASGIEVVAFVTRIAVREDAGPAALAEFNRELTEQAPPSAIGSAFPPRMVL